jgi:lipoprotein-anchoring transpeptidase ErfK/SrfK
VLVVRKSLTTRARIGAALTSLVLALALLAGCSSTEPPQAEGTTTSVPSSAENNQGSPSGEAAPGALANPPYQVAYAKQEGPLAIYGATGDAEETTTLPNPMPVSGGAATTPLVLLVKEKVDDGWFEVYLPVRPNGSTGFVKADDVRIQPHEYRIEVKLSAFNLKAFKGNEVILDTSVAVAAENTPTPGGLYYTNQLLKPPDPNTVYGTYAYGLSGYTEVSEVAEKFKKTDGQLGIHGTNDPSKIGQAVSSGCIRMRNEDIEKLAKTLPLGVPVIIEA